MIWCRQVKESEGRLYFWILDEKTEDEWVFYTSVEEEMEIYFAQNNVLFRPQTHLDNVKLLRMSEQYQEFLQSKS